MLCVDSGGTGARGVRTVFSVLESLHCVTDARR